MSGEAVAAESGTAQRESRSAAEFLALQQARQRVFRAYMDASRGTIRHDTCFVKILVVATENIGIATLSGLHHIKIIGIA